MRWPGRRPPSRDHLVLAWADQALAYVQATLRDDGLYQVQRCGVERQGADSAEDFAKRLAALGFKGQTARVMLRPEQYQIFQIDMPAVPAEELRAAARWQIRDMVDVHMDDLTLDVLRVGDDKVRTANHLFVVTAANAVIREVMAVAGALRCTVEVIDIQDLALRNLQTALARRAGALDRAQAALVVTDDNQALLTISANEELFYTRRIEVGEGFLQAGWEQTYGLGAPPETGADYRAVGLGDAPTTDYTDYGAASAPMAAGASDEVQRVVMEVHRSLDLWDRTWPMLPLGGVGVFAGRRSQELAGWLGQELGQTVTTLEVAALFAGYEGATEADKLLCWPLLGALMRTESRGR